jgi:hypothetical protein
MPGVLERGHKSDPLGYATRPLVFWQVLKRLAPDSFLGIIIAVLPNVLQFQAGAIQSWICANPPVPSCVMPGNPDRDMAEWIF